MKLAFLSALIPAILTAAASAQSTAFTYQGRLKNGTQLAAGLHDFRFTLFNVASGGVQLAPPQCVDNVAVTEGLFTTTIDFGQQFVTTEARFLQIEVRADTGLTCANPTGLVLLAPRQPLTAAPIATHARTAFALAAADGSPTNAVSVDNAGNVGIGTTTPTHTVHIASPEPTLALQDTDSTAQQVGYVSYRDSVNVERAWVGYGSADSTVFSIVNARPAGHIALLPISGGNVGIGTSTPANSLSVAGNADVTGNVGIGTTTPTVKLDVRGNIHLGDNGEFRAVAGQESLRIIRGAVAADGTPTSGSGFRVNHFATGQYLITFTTPFTGLPSVSAMAKYQSGAGAFLYENLQIGSVEIRTFNDNGFGNCIFTFIAIGPR